MDRSGTIDVDEVKAVFANFGEQIHPDVLEVLPLQHLLSFAPHLQLTSLQFPKGLMKFADADGNGKIELSEFMELLRSKAGIPKIVASVREFVWVFFFSLQSFHIDYRLPRSEFGVRYFQRTSNFSHAVGPTS